jgi:hypothetical protein
VIAGILVCIWWRQLIFKYKTLVGFRMKQLMEMEALPEMQGCHQMYLKEREELYKRDAQGRKVPAGRLNFSELEGRLPALFIVLYALFGLFLILALAWQMWKPPGPDQSGQPVLQPGRASSGHCFLSGSGHTGAREGRYRQRTGSPRLPPRCLGQHPRW